MENTIADTRPTFSRLTGGRSSRSWRAAIPAVVVVVAFVTLLGYLASKLSSSEQRAMTAERDTTQVREQQQGLVKQISMLQKDNAIAKSPGRVTVIVEPQDKGKGKNGKDKEAAPWAAVTWGELPDGKSFVHSSAYGLINKPESGKSWHLWFTPTSGDPIDLGALEADAEGNASTMVTELPPVDQGKALALTVDASGAKQPGDVLASVELPKLKPMTRAAAPEPAETPQAKSGSTSQQMHQESAKPDGK